MKVIFSIFALVFAIAINVSAQNTTFYTNNTNGKLYDPCGNQVVLRGVNYAVYNWGYDNTESRFREIAKTGANAVRIQWYASSAAPVYASTVDLARALDSCIVNKMIPILDIHDQTCANDPAALIAMANWFTGAAVKAVLQARQAKIILNVANEALYVNWAGNPVTAQTDYVNTYATICTNMRNAGYTCPLMIDAPDCGTNSDVLVATGTQLVANDPLHRIILDVHSYWFGFANNDIVVMNQKVQNLINTNIPFVVGELANYQDDNGTACTYLLPYAAFLTNCKNLGVAWLIYGWDRDQCASRQISTNGLYSSLTTYGNDVVNSTVYGLKTNSVRSPYIINGACAAPSNFAVTDMRFQNYSYAKTVAFYPPTTSGCATGGVLSYLWDFGDGTTATTANPTKNYTNAGVYNVCVTVTCTVNGVANNYQCCRSINIADQFVTCTPSFNYNILGTTLTGSFAGTANVGYTSVYTIFDANGTQINASSVFNNTAVHNYSYIFPAAGNYTVCRTVARNTNIINGALNEIKQCRTLGIGNTCNVTTRFYAVVRTNTPLLVALTNNSTNITTTNWSYSTAYNGVFTPIGTTATLNYTFPNYGTYWVKCVINQGTACEGSVIHRIELQSPSCASVPLANKKITSIEDIVLTSDNTLVQDFDNNIAPTVQPNPTTGIINVLLNKFSNENLIITLVNMQGQVLDTQKTNTGTAGLSFDINNYASGMYIINIINSKGERVTHKIIKQ